MRLFLLTLIISVNVLAGFPPTTSKLEGETTASTTFNYEFPYFTGTRTGITTSLGTLGMLGGGTGNNVLMANTYIPFSDGTKLITSSAFTFDTVGDGYRVNILGVQGAVYFDTYFHTMSNYPYAIDIGHRYNGTLLIDAAAPISNTDYFINGFTGSFAFNDDYTMSTLTKAGVSAAGSFLIIEGAVGKTAEKVSSHQAILAVGGSSAGGTVTEAAAYESAGFINLGGTLSVTNYYGYKHENLLGYAATNEWGIYVGGADAESYFERGIAIGTTSKKTSNASVGLEIGGTTKAMRLPVLTTAQKNALTPLAGMEVYDSDLGKISVYNGSIWQENTFGIVPMADGGTNKNMTASAGSVTYSDADSLELSAVGTSGQALISGGTGAPTWYAPTAGSILFAGTGGILEQDNANLNWDDANNRLMIGTGANSFTVNGSTKGSQLSVSGQGGSNAYEVAFHKHSATLNPVLSMIRSRGSEAVPSVVQNGDTLAELNFLGYDGVDYEYGAKIDSTVDAAPGSNDMPASLNFYTVPDGSSTPARAMKIAQNKIVTMDAYGAGILHSSAAGVLSSSAVSLTADVSGVLPIANGGTNNGSLGVTNGGICYADGSKLMMSAAGTSNQILQSNGAAAPSWISTLSIAQGGTNNGSLAVTAGGVIYSDGTKLVNSGAGTSGYVLTSGGSGAPTWSSVLTNPMTTGGDIIYGGSSGTPTRLANGSAGQVLMSKGSTTAPIWKDQDSSCGLAVSSTGTINVETNDCVSTCSNSSGSAVCNFNANYFSSTPICQVTINGDQTAGYLGVVSVSAISTSSVTIKQSTPGSGNISRDLLVTCSGPRTQ